MATMRAWMAVACLAGSGMAWAQPVVEKPAPSRFYGTARPPGSPGGAPVNVVPPAQVAPPVVVRPPVYTSPPASVYVPPPVYGRPPPPRVGVDVWVGPPRPYWYGPRYGHPGWGYPYGYAYPPAVVVPPPVVVSPPPVYVERPAEESAPVAGYWYWCADPQGFFPDVQRCPDGWQAVPPRAAQ